MVVDEDGFQQVQSKQGIRRNIFGNMNETMNTEGMNPGMGTTNMHTQTTGVAATAVAKNCEDKNHIDSSLEKTQRKSSCRGPHFLKNLSNLVFGLKNRFDQGKHNKKNTL